MTPARRAFVAALALAPGAGLIGCGAGPLTLPQPPQDLTALEAAYETPTGTIDAAQLQQIVTDAQAQFYASDRSWLAPLLRRTLVREWRRFADQGFPVDPALGRQKNRPELQAVVDVNHACQGWSTPSGAATATGNGDIALTAVVDDTQLRRQLWGTSSSCMEQVTALNQVTINAFLDGSLAILLQGPLPENEDQAQALVQVQGQMGVQNQVAGTSFDFRIVGPSVEFRYPVSDGYVVVSIGTQAIGVTGSNGSFTCDVAGLACTATP